jgi:RNA polymerase sigma factor (sigma-70 family)
MSLELQTRDSMSDEEAVHRFQETRDPECFSELFRRHRKQVFFACRRFFGEDGTAEDATQETFVRAYENIHRFREGDFSGWLMRIARNLCIDEWRRRRPEAGTEEIGRAAVPQGEALDRMSDWRFAARLVRQEMQKLSAEQRQCLELKIDGYSYEETAARTGLSLQAVKSHLQNGRRMLWARTGGTLSQLK